MWSADEDQKEWVEAYTTCIILLEFTQADQSYWTTLPPLAQWDHNYVEVGHLDLLFGRGMVML